MDVNMERTMEGRRVLITGGNSGIGKVAAIELAKRGAEVVLACRDSEKTAAAMREISAYGSVANLPVDLASLSSVKALAERFLGLHDRLDVLVNNAATFPARATLTEDGFEAQFGVNHLAHFLLTNLLLERLQQSAPARIVTVTSKLHRRGAIDFDSFRGQKPYSGQRAYAQSKLANVLFGLELADRLAGTGVTSNLLHPGAVRTEIMREIPWVVRSLINLFFIDVERGSRTSVMLASDPQLTDTTGKYFDQCRLADVAPIAQDRALRQRLWSESEALVERWLT
jgi:NAD(P)-dependent dehydrogenase (short-subunit alcohol dehydrogenase family)